MEQLGGVSKLNLAITITNLYVANEELDGNKTIFRLIHKLANALEALDVDYEDEDEDSIEPMDLFTNIDTGSYVLFPNLSRLKLICEEYTPRDLNKRQNTKPFCSLP